MDFIMTLYMCVMCSAHVSFIALSHSPSKRCSLDIGDGWPGKQGKTQRVSIRGSQPNGVQPDPSV